MGEAKETRHEYEPDTWALMTTNDVFRIELELCVVVVVVVVVVVLCLCVAKDHKMDDMGDEDRDTTAIPPPGEEGKRREL